MKAKTDKTKYFDYRSRRQVWQTYQHLLKAHEYFKICYQQVKKENNAIGNPSSHNQMLERYFNEAMIETWVTLNGLKRLSRRMFNCEIARLEIYK